jgi:hypothetical protein
LSPPTSPIPEPAPETTTVSASDFAQSAGGIGAALGDGSAPSGGGVGYPLAKHARLIGVPYEGTHGKAFNVAGGSDNWQSENAVDLGIAYRHAGTRGGRRDDQPRTDSGSVRQGRAAGSPGFACT